MSELLDASIDALRAHHDRLADLVQGLGPDELTGPSGASEWTLAQVLSHLGSGAEISLRSIGAGIAGEPAPQSQNEAIWDRWNAASPQEQAAWFVDHDEALVSALEAVPSGDRDAVQVDLGFLPAPVPLATAVGMRLNEVAAHTWDVEVGLDPQATLRPESADLLFRHFAEGLGFLLGFSGKTDQLDVDTALAVGPWTVVVEESVQVRAEGAPEATATFVGPHEAAMRMLSGRLTPEHTPAGTEVTGNVTLDDLRKVFPGY